MAASMSYILKRALSFSSLCYVFTCACLVGCRQPFEATPATQPVAQHRPAWMADVDSLRNDMILWQGQHFGLHPVLRSDGAAAPAERLLKEGAVVVDALIMALDDEKRYVAAHFLLTYIVRPGSIGTGPPRWNDLYVDLLDDGSVTFDPSDRPALIRKWRLATRQDGGRTVKPLFEPDR